MSNIINSLVCHRTCETEHLGIINTVNRYLKKSNGAGGSGLTRMFSEKNQQAFDQFGHIVVVQLVHGV